MEITRVFLCELPFILNLPNGAYDVPLPGGLLTLELLNGWMALHADQRRFAVGPPDELRANFPEFERQHRQPLRTVLRHCLTVDVLDDQLPIVGEAELLEDIGAGVVERLMGAGGPAEVTAEARRLLDAMSAEERDRRRVHGAALRHGSTRMLPASEKYNKLESVDTLEQVLLAQSLFRNAIVSYGKCFASAAAGRVTLDRNTVFAGQDGLKATHGA